MPLGQPQHHVGAAVVPRLVLDVELRLVVHAADEVRTVENRFENHLAPVALHLRVALQRVGQIGGLGGDAALSTMRFFSSLCSAPRSSFSWL